MATLLSQVKRGVVKRPHLVLIYGPDGCGKSTFGADAPAPIFLGSEEGTNNLDVSRFPAPQTWAHVTGAVHELLVSKHDYKTLVIDSLDWLEPLLHSEICKRHGVRSIELAAGGYGKGYTEAVNDWKEFARLIAELRDKRSMNIVMIGHSEVVRFSDPGQQAEYDRYQLKLYKKSAALLREFVDCVLFANFEVFTKKEGDRTRAFGDGARVMHTERRPGWDAKNRFGLDATLPLGWSEFDAAVSAAMNKPAGGDAVQAAALHREITALLETIEDGELKAKAQTAADASRTDMARLAKIKNHLILTLNK